MIPLCWILAVALFATTTVIAPLTFITLLEPGKSPVEIFALRGRSLPFVTIWTVSAFAAIVLVGFNGVVECVEIVSVVLAAFIPVCSWRVYSENYDFVEQFVKENKERMTYLLLGGIGFDEYTFESVCSTVETVLVEFWSKKLTKGWTKLSQAEIGGLMFTSGIETAKVIAEKLGKDSHWTVFAFMNEWQTYVERTRVPLSAKKELEGQSPMQQCLSCVAIFLANETKDVRLTRAQQSLELHFPCSPAAGAAAWKTATEGLLSWPDCLQRKVDIRIKHVKFNPIELYHVEPDERRCSVDDIPSCVTYTLTEMIKAGFILVPLNGKTTVAVFFRDSHVVFDRKDWNNKAPIERKPFRFIASATRLNGDPAFVIEDREVINGAVDWNGSHSIEGILNVEVDVTVRNERETWLHYGDVRNDDVGIWGELESFLQPRHPRRLNWLMLSIIQTVCDAFKWLKRYLNCLHIEEGISSLSNDN